MVVVCTEVDFRGAVASQSIAIVWTVAISLIRCCRWTGGTKESAEEAADNGGDQIGGGVELELNGRRLLAKKPEWKIFMQPGLPDCVGCVHYVHNHLSYVIHWEHGGCNIVKHRDILKHVDQLRWCLHRLFGTRYVLIWCKHIFFTISCFHLAN